MGGAYTAIADDATSTIWNPAGLPSAEDLSFTISTARLSFDRKHNFIGVVKKLNDTSALGLAIINAGVDDIPFYDDAGNSTGQDFDFITNAFSVSYGVAVDKLNFGATLRILTDSFGQPDGVDASSKTGFGGIDLGFIGNAFYSGETPTVSYGATLRNLAGSIGGSDLPALLSIGGAFRLLKKNRATFSVDLENQFLDIEESTKRVRLGAEYEISRTFAIRGGTIASRDRRSFFAGFGVNVGGLQLDYAFKPSDSSANTLSQDETHFMSLSYNY